MQRRGFTLIELSVVLVIIGLIIGAVLLGSDLLNSARIRQTVSDIQKVKAAINLFESRYNAQPGDFNKATTLWSADSPVNGNGNGYVLDTTSAEAENVWHHLKLAELVPGNFKAVSTIPNSYSSDPTMGYKASLAPAFINYGYTKSVVTTGNYAHAITLAGKTMMGTLLWQTLIPSMPADMGIAPSDALSLDRMIDDGLPETGKVISAFNYVAMGSGPYRCIGIGSKYSALKVNNCVLIIQIND